MTIPQVIDNAIAQSTSRQGGVFEIDSSDAPGGTENPIEALTNELSTRSTSNHLRDDHIHEFYGPGWRVHVATQ